MKKGNKMPSNHKRNVSNGMKESWKRRRAVKELTTQMPVVKISEPVSVKKAEPNWKMIAMELMKTQLV